jgi:hypothetical protein
LKVFTPFAIASQLLNVDPAFIPFVPRTFTSLVGVIMACATMLSIVLLFLEYQGWLWKFAMGWTGRRQNMEKTGGWSPEWLRPRSNRSRNSQEELPIHSTHMV